MGDSGQPCRVIELEGVPSTVIICHNEFFPELVRLPAMAGARLAYYISHEVGITKESKIPGYRAQMMARAVENGLFVVAANAPGDVRDNSGSHGQSRIIKSDGNILQEASIYGEDVLVESLLVCTATPGWIQEHLEGTRCLVETGAADLLEEPQPDAGMTSPPDVNGEL